MLHFVRAATAILPAKWAATNLAALSKSHTFAGLHCMPATLVLVPLLFDPVYRSWATSHAESLDIVAADNAADVLKRLVALSVHTPFWPWCLCNVQCKSDKVLMLWK